MYLLNIYPLATATIWWILFTRVLLWTCTQYNKEWKNVSMTTQKSVTINNEIILSLHRKTKCRMPSSWTGWRSGSPWPRLWGRRPWRWRRKLWRLSTSRKPCSEWGPSPAAPAPSRVTRTPSFTSHSVLVAGRSSSTSHSVLVAGRSMSQIKKYLKD